MTENELREIEIEKLACAVCKAVYNNGECGSCQHLLESKVIARKLFDNDVRKIPDGAVVLSKEEYEKLRRMPNFLSIDFTRKETAMEILNELFNNVTSAFIGSHQYVLTDGDKKRIAKKYGVEVEE